MSGWIKAGPWHWKPLAGEAVVGLGCDWPDGDFCTGVWQQLWYARYGFVAVDLPCKWELQQGVRVYTLARDCEQRCPSRHPGHPTCRTEVRVYGGFLLPGEKAQQSLLSSDFFPTLAVGLLDLKVDVVLARLEADFRYQPPSISAVLNHKKSHPYTAQPPSIPAVPNHRRVSLQCPTAGIPYTAQPPSIPAVPNHRKVSLQCPTRDSLHCPTTKYPCSAQPPSIPAVPNRRVSLHCPTAKYPCNAQPLKAPEFVSEFLTL